MSEVREQWKAIIKVFIAFICGCLYAWAGTEYLGLWARRFLAPGIAVVSMFIFTNDWKVFITLPFWMGALSLGYGADTTGLKIFKRLVFGSANGVASSIYNTCRKKWLLVGYQIGLLCCVYCLFGVFNPLPNARHEELFLGFMVFLIPILSAEKK